MSVNYRNQGDARRQAMELAALVHDEVRSYRMPKLGEDYETAAESTAGERGFTKVEPGCYMCRVMAVQTEWTTSAGVQHADDRECVRVVLDIDEGECAGEYQRDFYDGREWMHSLFMSWKPSALGLLKHTFAAFDEANAGFDARAAFEADKWELFCGMRVRVLWNGRERTNARGFTDVDARPDRCILACEDPVPKVELERGGKVDWPEYRAATAPSTAAGGGGMYSGDDIPF